MSHKTAIIDIRKRLGVPIEGFFSLEEALSWYREHYKKTKREELKGTFGFNYDPNSRYIDFEYSVSPYSLQIQIPQPLDVSMPLDHEVVTLAKELKLPDWIAPALRPVVLVGNSPEVLQLDIPNHSIASLGSLRILIHPAIQLSLRNWRKIGKMIGVLPSESSFMNIPGMATVYSSKRERKLEYKYWETFNAYLMAIGNRRKNGIKGKKGLLVETAKLLADNKEIWKWEFAPDTYTVRRYLDQAEKTWRVSTHFETYNNYLPIKKIPIL